jgi:hypothetical protein
LFRTSHHPHLTEAVRQAELLHRFKIKAYDAQFALWLNKQGVWNRVGMFPSREDAEAYLFSKLPAIESEM